MKRFAVPFAFLALCAMATPANFGRVLDFEAFSRLATQRYGAPTRQLVEQWRDMLAAARGIPEAEKVRRVNDFFNRRIVYQEDSEIWGQSDYWATPLEVMGRGAADCEDFAIAKYFSLMLLAVPTDRLRITYVKARTGGPHSTAVIAHMVLGYYPDPTGEPMILDNLLHDVRPASQRPDLTPVFSFNSEGLWVGAMPGTQSNGNAAARLSKWSNLLVRLRADGFE